jgi:GT2 family glycosyltransferase
MALLLTYISKYNKKYVQKRVVIDSGCEISMGVGACYVLTSSFIEKIGNLYFPWFLYGEEACLAWQVRDAGGIIWYDPDLIVSHAESASCSKLPSRLAYDFGRESYWGYRHLL